MRLEVHSSDLRKHLNKYLDLVSDEAIGILRVNRLEAVLLSVDEYEQFQRLKDAFIAADVKNSQSGAWLDQEKASRLASELPKRSDETDG